MPSRVILSADSTCDLNPELKTRYEVDFYPFHIILDARDYRDNVDITTDEIYATYHKKRILPKTAAIGVGEYLAYFKPFIDAGYEVVHLNLGGALSSAYENCKIAAAELDGVYPVDSQTLSTAIGLQIIEARKLIEQGLSASEVAAEIESARSRCHASFILDTLEFMQAGGRCSAVSALMASLINIKPCIEVDNADGSMSVGKKYRGRLDHVLVNYTKEKLTQYPDIRTDHLFITHSGVDKRIIGLVHETIRETLPVKEIHVTRASCTIGAHCGPNTLGVLFMTETPSK